MLNGYYYQVQIEKLVKVPRITNANPENSEIVEKVIQLFNESRLKSGISKQPLKVTFERKKLIQARVKDKYTFEDFERVILCKFDDWVNNPKMKKYLTPETLFRPSNFAKYLDESNATKKEGWTTKETKTVKPQQNELAWKD